MKNKETLELVTNAAKGKIGLLKEGKGKYQLRHRFLVFDSELLV